MEIRRRQAAADIDTSQYGDLPDLLKRLYAHRDVRDPKSLDYGLAALESPASLGGLEAAAELLAKHFDGRILIVGDFDADGATSTALGLLALRRMGATHVDFLVPDRFRFGYGLTPEIVALAVKREPSLIVTVDNGISSITGVQAAREAGIDVLVTDHHLPGARLPAANVIVNPNSPGDEFPSKALAGVGVMFYVLLALRKCLREQGEPGGDVNLAEWLDLVALGTVADVVPLDANNRRLVHQGLARIRAGEARPGILALIDVAGRSRQNMTASDLGFALGPRLNAAGRLDDMSIGINCLVADDHSAALQLATQLDEFNRSRRDIEQTMQDEALAAIDKLHLNEQGDHDLPTALCLFQEEWHQGVVGLVASRIKERWHRPVIAFAPSDPGSATLKGSARSIPGFHIRDALDTVATKHPGLIDKFGGHAMAAGLSLDRDKLDTFEAAFNAEASRLLDKDDLKGVLWSDGELAAAELSLETAELLRSAGPWGQHFPEPLFDGEFGIAEQRIVGERHLKLKLAGPGGQLLDAIAFGVGERLASDRVRAAFRLDVNEWRGRRSVQLIVDHLEPR
ncbi:MAG: single-stranded-DNA-specific exonuclease RecJ [Gammaproteobacteria bacterium]|nr:single-stranded-DNA-specific exonuclease RecJ [Gammaproteobacteria bacterium]